jgi:diphthine synthase
MNKKEVAKKAGDEKSNYPLFFVGLGLCDEQDLSIRSLEVLRGCKTVFAENYTNVIREGTLSRLEEKIGRKIIVLEREEVEKEDKILDACTLGPCAFLVPGDPMAATTHNSLLISARKKNIQAHILHSSSIFTAAPAAAGLQIYKMGKTATIAYWRKNYEPVSFVDIIAENNARGAHTLCLLDIDPKEGAMKPSAALNLIYKAQEKKKIEDASFEPAVCFHTKLFVLWHVGWPDQKIWAGEAGEYPYSDGEKEEPEGPAVIIIAGKMHFMEEESWQHFKKINSAKKPA